MDNLELRKLIFESLTFNTAEKYLLHLNLVLSVPENPIIFCNWRRFENLRLYVCVTYCEAPWFLDLFCVAE